MDPIAIVTLSGSIIHLCWSIARSFLNFASEVQDLEDDLSSLAAEVSSISKSLKAVEAALNGPTLTLLSKDNYYREVWGAVQGSIEDLNRSLDRLQIKIDAVKKVDQGRFKLVRQTLEMHFDKDSIANIRAALHTHQLSLNTSLTMVGIYVQAQQPNQQQLSLKHRITDLKRMAERLPEYADEWIAEQSVYSFTNITRLRDTAMKVVSNASDVTSSQAPTQVGEDGSFKRQRTETWVRSSLQRLDAYRPPVPEKRTSSCQLKHSGRSPVDTSSRSPLYKIPAPKHDLPEVQYKAQNLFNSHEQHDSPSSPNTLTRISSKAYEEGLPARSISLPLVKGSIPSAIPVTKSIREFYLGPSTKSYYLDRVENNHPFSEEIIPKDSGLQSPPLCPTIDIEGVSTTLCEKPSNTKGHCLFGTVRLVQKLGFMWIAQLAARISQILLAAVLVGLTSYLIATEYHFVARPIDIFNLVLALFSMCCGCILAAFMFPRFARLIPGGTYQQDGHIVALSASLRLAFLDIFFL